MEDLTVHFTNGDTDEYEGVKNIFSFESRYAIKFDTSLNKKDVHIQKSAVQKFETNLRIKDGM
jgi:hypothetical protein